MALRPPSTPSRKLLAAGVLWLCGSLGLSAETGTASAAATTTTPTVAAAAAVAPAPPIGRPIQAAPARRHAPPADLRTFQSRHYLIHTDLPRRLVVPYGRHIDAVYTDFTRRFEPRSGPADTSAQQPASTPGLDLYLVGTRERYLAHLDAVGVRGTHSGGMFYITPRGRGLATYVRSRSEAETFSVLQHEGFHQFAWLHYRGRLPQWLNEGIAQVFEDAPLVDGRLHPGPIQTGRLMRIQRAVGSGQALPLSRLMQLGPMEWTDLVDRYPERSGLVYAQAWSVVYFLVHGGQGRYRQGFARYLDLLEQGVPDGEALPRAFGVRDLEPMEARWRVFIRDLKPGPLDDAGDRLRFLAASLRYLDSQDQPMPRTLNALRDLLQRIGFAVQRTEDGVQTTLRASDARHFSFVASTGRGALPGGTRSATPTRPRLMSFQLLEPAGLGLPPRITAPGLVPQPTLTWSRHADGTLMEHLTYR